MDNNKWFFLVLAFEAKIIEQQSAFYATQHLRMRAMNRMTFAGAYKWAKSRIGMLVCF